MTAWLVHNYDAILVNLVSGLPFLLFDLAIIALILPLAIDALRNARTREARRIALFQITNVYQRAIVTVYAASDRSKRVMDLSQRRQLLLTETKEALSTLSNGIPLFMPVLDSESITLVTKANMALDTILGQIHSRASFPSIKRDEGDYDQDKRSIAYYCSMAGKVVSRSNRLGGARLEHDPARDARILTFVLDVAEELGRSVSDATTLEAARPKSPRRRSGSRPPSPSKGTKAKPSSP